MLWNAFTKKGGRAVGLALLVMAMAGCGGDDDPVGGSATPVPEPAPQPTPTPVPTPVPTDPTRFEQVAPDPHAAPTHMASPALEYELGHLPARAGIPAAYDVFLTPVRGWIRFPMAAQNLPGTSQNQRFPVVLLLHGNHTAEDPSYRGYDYLARNLAEHGYVAISIDANAINALTIGEDEETAVSGDPSSVSRAQLILGTLDRLRQIDAGGGPGMLSMLQGRLDFERIGMMGHSRGGQGLSNAIKFNLQRDSVVPRELKAQLAETPELFADYPALTAAVTASGAVDEAKFQSALQQENIFFSPTANAAKPYHFRAGMLLAPTDFFGTVGLSNIPLAVVLPSCDGDVLQLQGARTFDNNRFGFDYDTATRIQTLVRGGNHNYYNTEWTSDDTNGWADDPYCDAGRDNSPHLNPDDQRRGGLFLINGFMRHFVGGETAFGPYWNGLAQLPAAACPEGQWPCDARVVQTVQKDEASRLVVHKFAYANSLTRNDLGGAVALQGFDAAAWCDMPYGGRDSAGYCLPTRLPGFEHDPRHAGGMRSIAEHVQLAWSRPDARVSMALGRVSASAYDSLTFRVAVVRPFGQEVVVTLTDAAGRSASVKTSQYSDALYSSPHRPASGTPLVPNPEDVPYADGQVDFVLNMAAIPLGAFHGIDLNALTQLDLTLPGQQGKVALTDVQFQTLGREVATQ